MCVQVLASGLKVEKRERNFRSLVGTFFKILGDGQNEYTSRRCAVARPTLGQMYTCAVNQNGKLKKGGVALVRNDSDKEKGMLAK